MEKAVRCGTNKSRICSTPGLLRGKVYFEHASSIDSLVTQRAGHDVQLKEIRRRVTKIEAKDVQRESNFLEFGELQNA